MQILKLFMYYQSSPNGNKWNIYLGISIKADIFNFSNNNVSDANFCINNARSPAIIWDILMYCDPVGSTVIRSTSLDGITWNTPATVISNRIIWHPTACFY